MGQFGRITTVANLPSRRELVRLIRHAASVSAAPEASPEAEAAPSRRPPRAGKPPLPVPDVLAAALRRNAAARKTFETLSNSHRREYIEWLVEARREETRSRRVAQAIEWLAKGKSRNWKYEAC